MKLALITGSAGDHHCGVGDYAWWLAQFLAIEAEVHLYYARDHAPVDPPFPRLSKLELRPVGGYSALSMPAFASRLSNEGYDIIHLQYPSKGFGSSVGPGVLFQRLTGMQSRSRLVVTLHEWTTSHTLRRALMEQIITVADGLMLTNELEINALISKFTHSQITALPVGNVLRAPIQMDAIWQSYDGNEVEGLEEPVGPGNRKPYSLFHYGLPAAGKGFGRLLEAVKLVRDAGIDVVLHFFGDLPAGDKQSESILGQITELNLADAVVRQGHIPQSELESTASRYCLGVFPFDEGFSSKRSSVASISHVELPIVVGGGSIEDHPYYAPEKNTAASLAVLLVDLLKGRCHAEWKEQVKRQRKFATRFSFPQIAAGHLDFYRKMRKDSG